MADYSALLQDFATVVGLLKQTGSTPPDYEIDWTWFGDPLGHIVGSGSDPTIGLPAHRDSIGQLLVDMDSLRQILSPDFNFARPISLPDRFFAV